MASLPTGSDKLLEIRTADVDFVIKTKGKQPGTVIGNSVPSSSVKVFGGDIERISIPVKGITECYTDNCGNSIHEFAMEPLFFEQTDYVITIRSRKNKRIEFQSNSSRITERIGSVIDNDYTLLSGVINYGNNVGFSDYYISTNDRLALRITVEVYPSKISYREDYHDMMTDINNMVSESALDFLRKTYQVFVPDHSKNNTPAIFFTILQTIYVKFVQALNRILLVPHHKLITEHDVLPFHKVKKTDNKSIKWLHKHPEFIVINNQKFLAERALSAEKRITYDTQENRIVKFMLLSTVRRIEDFLRRYQKCTKTPDEKVVASAIKMSGELRRLLTSTFLESVADYNASRSMSLVFGMAPGYRELYKYYLMLQSGFSVGGDVFRISVRETAQLYEYWCFIKLYSILKDARNNAGAVKYSLVPPDIIKVDRKGVTVDLAKGKSSQVVFLNTRTGERIVLSYNLSESKTQTVNQRPDNVLELEKNGSKTAYKYVFDAKYRIENNPNQEFYPDSKPGPKVDDINTMHRYRDSIVYENQDSRFTFEKTMFGAYVLFPYKEENEYREHRFYHSIETVNIGGLPFLPSATGLVTELLDTLISDSSESAFERATLPAGIEERIKTVDWKKRDVLIGLVPDHNHLQLFLDNKMFFTRRFRTKNLPIRYVALYEKGSGIQYVGEVISWRMAERTTLPGTSMYKGTYHVFEVLQWESLPSIIKAAETGPGPIAYTNYFLLNTVSTYSELHLKSEEEYRLFNELKRCSDTVRINEENANIAFILEDIKIMTNEDRIFVINNERVVGSCLISDFRKKPNTTFRIIQGYIDFARKQGEKL